MFACKVRYWIHKNKDNYTNKLDLNQTEIKFQHKKCEDATKVASYLNQIRKYSEDYIEQTETIYNWYLHCRKTLANRFVNYFHSKKKHWFSVTSIDMCVFVCVCVCVCAFTDRAMICQLLAITLIVKYNILKNKKYFGKNV